MNKELSKEEIFELILLRAKREKIFELLDRYADQQAKKEAIALFRFAEWASHSDWTYLPSKQMWYNEEDEDNITPMTTEELYKLFNQQK